MNGKLVLENISGVKARLPQNVMLVFFMSYTHTISKVCQTLVEKSCRYEVSLQCDFPVRTCTMQMFVLSLFCTFGEDTVHVPINWIFIVLYRNKRMCEQPMPQRRDLQ